MNYAPDLTTAAIKMVLSLGVVLLIVWVLYRMAKSKLPMHRMGGMHNAMQVVESRQLGLKKSIAMVKVPGSVLVLGIGTDRVNLLTKIDDPEILKALSVEPEKQRVTGFREQLRRLTRPNVNAESHTLKETLVE